MENWSTEAQKSFTEKFQKLGFEVNVSDTVLTAMVQHEMHFIEFNLDVEGQIEKQYFYCQFTKCSEEDGAFFIFAHEVGDNIPYCAAKCLSSTKEEGRAIANVLADKSNLFLNWFKEEGFDTSNLVGFDGDGAMEQDSINGVVRVGFRQYVNYKDIAA